MATSSNGASISIEIVGARDLAGKFAHAPAVMEDRQVAELGGAMREVLALYRERAPKNKRRDDSRNEKRPDEGAHGLFSESFHGDIARAGGSKSAVTIRTDQPILREFLEKGTRPHEIVPSAKMALSFQVDGDQIIASKVNHPGTKANKWEETVKPEAEEIFKRAGNKVAARVMKSLENKA